jgi:hypothetical protein
MIVAFLFNALRQILCTLQEYSSFRSVVMSPSIYSNHSFAQKTYIGAAHTTTWSTIRCLQGSCTSSIASETLYLQGSSKISTTRFLSISQIVCNQSLILRRFLCRLCFERFQVYVGIFFAGLHS